MRILSASLFLVGGAALLAVSLGQRRSLIYPLAYSQALITALILLFGILLVALLRDRRASQAGAGTAGTAGQEVAGPDWIVHLRPLAGLIACFAYLLLWDVTGHLPATVLFLVAMLLIGGERRVLPIVAISAGVALVIHFLFVDFLSIPLPHIPWETFGWT